jgi:hypothetical protein
MSEQRREAWRITHHGTGWLAAPGFRANCTVEDISVTGARVHIDRARLRGPLPEVLSLTVMVGGEQVTVPGTLARVNREATGLALALEFVNGDAVGLGWLINQAQRQAIAGHSRVTKRPGG